NVCGFAAKDIVTLTDFDATKRNMQAAIRDLVKSGRSGDVLLLHYSGHGANVPDANGDEADGRDEILCPTDLDWKDPLTDDWLRTTFDRLRAGVNLTVIMDCCHSGSNTRAILPPDAPSIPRYLPNPWDMMAEESGRKLRGKVRVGIRAAPRAARRRSDVATVDIPEVLVTGCRDTQTSADARIGGTFNGALTYNLVAAIRAKKGRLSYRDLHALAKTRLAKSFTQVPQLEGRKENLARPFLAPIV
ncbi:MAG: caspase family protein, partial [Planctomycetes bacterium]|nr:caspase family protein [Planctomycetota bacterium]